MELWWGSSFSWLCLLRGECLTFFEWFGFVGEILGIALFSFSGFNRVILGVPW